MLPLAVLQSSKHDSCRTPGREVSAGKIPNLLLASFVLNPSFDCSPALIIQWRTVLRAE
jgi:hypothetical protein